MSKHARERKNLHCRRSRLTSLAVLCALVAWAACTDDSMRRARHGDPGDAAPGADASHSDGDVSNSPDASAARDAMAGSQADPTRPALCDRPGDDPVRDKFCAGAPPSIRSLEDFQNLFNVNPRGPARDADEFTRALYINAVNGDIAVTGHSTALSGHLVSPINPRAILMGDRIVLAYQRGVQRLEFVSIDRNTYAYNFYLLTFTQACNERDGGCSPGELFTPEVERDWLQIQLRDAEDLKNTPSDCRQCHQRGSQQPSLLMRELRSPWTHFLFPIGSTDGTPGVTGADLMRDYLSAKGDELYGGLDMGTIAALGPFKLETIAGNAQPLLFDAPRIQNERWPYGPNGYASAPQPSPSWNAAYEAFKRGEQLALPYVEQRAVDVAKQAELAKAYQRYRAGELTARELPDFADIYPDDPRIRAEIGLTTEPDATPVEALIQACGACHNDALDQSISRARFTIALGRLERAELDVAIDRISRPRNAPGVMPPPEARQFAPGVRERLLEYLRTDLNSSPIDPLLERAATLGMTGGGG
jgi:hypothetical protein